MRCFQFAAVFALMLSCAMATSAQTVIGHVDWVDNDSVLGWACLQGNSTTFLPVYLWAYQPSNASWTYLGTEYADKGRDDVGGVGVCGTMPEAFFHGFELTIFPETLIATQGTYEIYAYTQGQQLPGSGTVSFATTGFPTSITWRTDYDDPSLRSVAMVSCIWPFKGANPISHAPPWSAGNGDDEDPLFLHAGATILGGPVEPINWCMRNDATDPTSWDWSQSNSATNASTWPMSNFWVVSANNELAYSKTQTGPPSQSQPINTGDIYSVEALTKSSFRLAIDSTKPGYGIYDFPFLSIGAQMGRGTDGPIGWIQPNGQDTHVEFQVRQLQESVGDYHDVAVYVEMMWGGYKHWIGISLSQPTQHRYHWNWNALESFWFPGGEFNLLGTQTLLQRCQLSNAQLPVLSPWTLGQTLQVSIPVRGIMECFESINLPNLHGQAGGYLGWSQPRPTHLPLAITGVHLAIEQADGQPNASMQTVLSKPTLVNY